MTQAAQHERSPADARVLPAVDRALEGLAELRELVTGLALLRDPSVRRPWREIVLDPAARAELDYAARLERVERTEDAPGEHQDAARADVLDVLSRVLRRAEELAWHLSRAAWCPVLPPAPADGDPRPYLARAAACLPVAVTGWANGRDIAYWAAGLVAAMRADVDQALALVIDGQTVKVICPWCKGRTSTAPVGGAYTWRVRIVPGGEPAIVCESGTCQPSRRDVTTWWAGTPVWPLRDWPWLARRVAHLARRDQAAASGGLRGGAEGATGRAGTLVAADAARTLLAGLTENDAWDPVDDPEGDTP